MTTKINPDIRNDFSSEVYKKDWQWQEGEYTVTRSCVWSGPGCHNGCGVLYYTKDGQLVKVEGDPNSGFNNGRLCMRCLVLPEAVYHPTRLLYPMKRAGERGENKWERITWDEAYDIIEEKVRKIWKDYGGRSIVCCFGTGRNATWQLPFLAYMGYKSPNCGGGFLSGDCCYAPRLMAMQLIFGATFIADCSQLFEKRYDDERWVPPKYIVNWGCNPVASNADGFYGHWIVDCMKRGSKLITVDPRVTWLAAKSDIHLQIRPGTDAAVAMAMLNVIINEELYDKDFVDKWCYGFEELKEAVAEMTPARAAEISWAPEEKITEIARILGRNKPWAMQWGLPVDQSKHGVSTSLALGALVAITGNVDIPGGNALVTKGYVQADFRAALLRQLDEKIFADRLGNEDSPLRKYGYINQSFPDALLRAIETEKPYPIKMLHISSTNTFANMGAEAHRVLNAMKKVDFIVVADLFITPTAVACADILLPVAMSPERMGIRAWWNPLRSITKVIEPLGEAKSDETIALDLVRRLNPENAPWKDEKEFTDYCMANLQSAKFDGTYDDLVRKVDDWIPFEYRKYEKGLLRPDGEVGFNTPTGKIELKVTQLEQFGYPALPYYQEPTESPVSTPELMKEYPFVLTTGQRSFEFFHSEHRQLKSMREFHPDPIMEINPEDAAALGIKDGDWVWLENKHGKCKQRARLNPGMLKGVVNAEHGWWFPEKEAAEPSLYGAFESNINCLTTQFDYGPTTFGAPYKTQICKVYKA